MIDEAEVRKTLNLIKGDGELVEIRILSANRKENISGYFKSIDKAIECLKKQDLSQSNVYFVLNRINDACYSRLQRDKFVLSKTTTGDNDIEVRDWILIDLDPKRPSGTSSTQEQVEKSLEKSSKIHNFLLEQGFPRPIIGFSGNGYHLLYRVKMKKNEDSNNLVKQFLLALDELFSDDVVEVDKTTFNASRISKLYGTVARKGLNTEERPHRMTRIVKVPDEIKIVEAAYIQKICNIVKPEEQRPNRYNSYNSNNFDIEDWMQKYGLNYTAYSYGTGTKYCLEHCPFDSSHTKKDAAIFKRSNGAIAFKCLHNSCSDKTWKDVRLMFEPDAYSKQREYENKQMFHSYNREQPKDKEPPHIKPKEGKSVFYTANEIIHRPKRTEQIIKTGIELFDKQYRGLRKNDVTILSGQTGGSKSTLLSQIILNAVDAGNNTAVFSGELSSDDFMRWMNLQAAGKAFIEPTQYENYFNVPFKYQEKIANWLEGRFWLYNNEYGFNFNAIMEQLEKMIDEHKLDLLCIDNLMALDISDLSPQKYDAQSKFAWQLHELAKRKHIHIIIVCHPKKPVGLLGAYDISGTSDIVNATDNIIFIYRRNQMFENSYAQFFGCKYDGEGTNIWHCAKARFGSVSDDYCPLFYEVGTKRLKNSPIENVVYGWQEEENISQLSFVNKTDFVDIELPNEVPF